MPAKNILKFFDRPTEPVFMPKGDDNSVFQVPEDYVFDRYKPLRNAVSDRFMTENKIPITKIPPANLPDLSLPFKLGRRDNFSLFIPSHRKMAARLIEVFMGMKTYDDFQSAVAYCRDQTNPWLFNYALSVAILHRPDTKHLEIPPLCDLFPDRYVDGAVFARVKEELTLPSGLRKPIEISKGYTASDLDLEHRVAYFREDLGINLHHWHWHLVYPFEGPREIVEKDRRGELFFYMHQQILARYNMERLCNNLPRVKRFTEWRSPIEEAYFPKLDSLVSSRAWPPRFENTTLKNISRELDELNFDIQDLERWRDRIYSAIHSGSVVDEDGKFVELTESGGIDMLGNILEASILSVNRNVYGDLHNLGHLVIGLCHDPEAKHLEPFSVMGDSSTAMRDPIFYRWHAFIDDIFREHKNTLPRYSVQQLDFPEVRVTSVEITSDKAPKNQLSTFWQQSDVNMSRGLDFSPRGPIYVRFTHLQHTPFTYQIKVEYNGHGRKGGTVRIFIAPKFDERGVQMLLRDQKNLFVELDKFVVTLKPGENTIKRDSTDSSVTIPFQRTFRNLDESRPEKADELERFNFCGCGWPQHMLVAKGSLQGFPCQLFVMVSDYNDDKVEQGPVDFRECKDAASFCGIRDNKYPDKRPMGYPFDRLLRDGVTSLEQFVTPNMFVQDVIIKHTDTISPGNQQAAKL